jgi:MmgE/PrpD N-terminal domain
MASAGERALPDEVVEKVKHHILDTFAAMISGSTLPPARAALDFALGYATDTTATIAASAPTANPLEAALVNGMLAQSDAARRGRPKGQGPLRSDYRPGADGGSRRESPGARGAAERPRAAQRAAQGVTERNRAPIALLLLGRIPVGRAGEGRRAGGLARLLPLGVGLFRLLGLSVGFLLSFGHGHVLSKRGILCGAAA